MKTKFIVTHIPTGKEKVTYTDSWEAYSRIKQILSEVNPEVYSYTEKSYGKKTTFSQRQRATKKYRIDKNFAKK